METNELIALRELINIMHDKANKAPIFNAAERAWKQINAETGLHLGGIADLCDYISRETGKRSPAKLSSTGKFEPAFTLEVVLREIWESKFPFDNCAEPSKPLGFCSPHEGNWGKTWADLTDPQIGLAKFSIMKYREGCAEQGTIPKYLGGKGYTKPT